MEPGPGGAGRPVVREFFYNYINDLIFCLSNHQFLYIYFLAILAIF
jgi:hypothetical protein